jgi:hypothetical protein
VSASRGSCASGQVVVAKQLCLIRALDALIKCEKAGLGNHRKAEFRHALSEQRLKLIGERCGSLDPPHDGEVASVSSFVMKAAMAAS